MLLGNDMVGLMRSEQNVRWKEAIFAAIPRSYLH